VCRHGKQPVVFGNNFVERLAAQQTHQGSNWFQGTADAVRATLNYTTCYRSELVLILSGDHLYRMDYGDLIRKEVLPSSLGSYRVMVYPFTDYWKDIGTIGSFFEANIALAQSNPPFPLYQPCWPLYTRERSLPPSRVIRSEIKDSLLVEGSDITGASICQSIVGERSIIREGSELRNVIMMEADFYEGEESLSSREAQERDLPPTGVGKTSVIERAIIDKNACIGDGVVIHPKPGITGQKNENYWVVDGITIIPKWAVIHPGREL